MRTLILTLAIVISGMLGQAQKLEIDKIDDFTGQTLKATKTEKIATSKVRNVLYMRLGAVKDQDSEIYIMYAHSSLDQGCAGARGNKMIIKFTDGETITLDDIGRIDCADQARSSYDLTNFYTDISDKTIDKVRFYQGDTYDDFILDLDKSMMVKRMLQIVTL